MKITYIFDGTEVALCELLVANAGPEANVTDSIKVGALEVTDGALSRLMLTLNRPALVPQEKVSAHINLVGYGHKYEGDLDLLTVSYGDAGLYVEYAAR